MPEDPENLGVSVEVEIQKDRISSGGRVREMPMPRQIASKVCDAGWVNRPGWEGVGAAQDKTLWVLNSFTLSRPNHQSAVPSL